MAVLVQEIINVDYAFVMHTTNPSSEDSTEIYAEVVKGLGETLVGAYPGRGLSFVCYAGAGLFDSVPTDEEEKVVLDYSTDPLIVNSKFRHSILSNIAKAGHAIKELYGSLQDIDGVMNDGWGTNEKLIISILAHRNAAQCNLICKTYAETYIEDLLKSLEKELSSDFERVILLWTMYPAERDVFLANEATKRWTSNNRVLMEIACTRSSHELLLARKAYHSHFKKSHEEDVAFHTTEDFHKLLVLLVSSYRYDGPKVNMKLSKKRE
ncbi:hypothetical protein GIB67_001352 [Kingdonia uniflora]|uniref:Uncharacterized protein n=1 Tax=Kingdonia uniflora TaxID=39325 RepID=A0A7J7MTN2_9MAGN|nr:hypothetical protein GIB67_001352 [Kingdonia uniflora]